MAVAGEHGLIGAGHGRRCGNRAARLGRGVDGLAIGAEDLHPEEEADRVFLELRHHGFEHVEGFLLVGHQRILLRITAQADAFLQVIHGEQVVFPEAVDHAEHDHALVVAHLRSGEDFSFCS